jgi:LCP family protein required for cell wall assembly
LLLRASPGLPSRRNRHVQVLLSSLWPGLGQYLGGARVVGLVLALPPLVLLGLGIAALVAPDRLGRLALLLDPAVLAGFLIAELVLFAWRVLGITDAFVRGNGPRTGRAAALSALGLGIVLVPSVYGAYLTEVAREAATAVFSTVEAPYVPPASSEAPYQDGEAIDLGRSNVLFSPPPELGRFTVLLIGNDSGAGRDHLLTDTMIVASLDPIAHSVSMISVPRDMVDVPLGDGRSYREKINSLVSFVRQNPGRFPGAPSGEAVLEAALGNLLGVRIDGWAEINLPGFTHVVDALGGIDVYVRDGFCDARYDEYGIDGFAITPGRYHFNGDQALAYARVRKAAGESDFTRAARQQELIVAARDRVVGGGFLTDPAGFIRAMGQLVTTSVEPATLAQYVDAASGISRDHVFRQVIQYPLVHGTTGDPRGSIQIPDLAAIHALGVAAYPPAGTLPVGLETIPDDPGGKTRSTLPNVTCTVPVTPAPTRTPGPSSTPNGTPQPTDTPAPSPSPTDKPGGPPTPEPSPAPSDTPGP